MSSFGRPPPSPSSDDVIYEQPLIIKIYKNIRFHIFSVDELCCNISESTTNARTPLFLCFHIQILDRREDWLGGWPLDAKNNNENSDRVNHWIGCLIECQFK